MVAIAIFFLIMVVSFMCTYICTYILCVTDGSRAEEDWQYTDTEMKSSDEESNSQPQ